LGLANGGKRTHKITIQVFLFVAPQQSRAITTSKQAYDSYRCRWTLTLPSGVENYIFLIKIKTKKPRQIAG